MKAIDLLQKFGVAYEAAEGSAWLKLLCPWHVDQEHANGLIQADSGRFECKACGHKADVYDVVSKKAGIPRSNLQRMVKDSEEQLEDAIPVGMIDKWHLDLMQSNQKCIAKTEVDGKEKILKFPNPRQLILERKGINEKTLQKYVIGWNGERFTIPVMGANKEYVNVRLWSAQDRNRKVINMTGFGKRRLLPIQELDHDIVIVTEGELKALFLCQLGYHAVSPTGGAKTWDHAWNELFTDKHVIIIYDIDRSGQEGASVVQRGVMPFAKTVKVVLLPMDTKVHPKGDVIDFILRCGKTKEDLDNAIDAAKVLTLEPSTDRPDDDQEVYPSSLALSSHAKFYNKFVEVPAIVSAKDSAPYIVPSGYKVNCSRDEEYCVMCPIFRKAEDEMTRLDHKNPALLQLMGVPEVTQREALKRVTGIPSKCSTCRFKVEETVNIEDLRLIPQVNIASNADEHVVHRAFYVGHSIDTNSPYVLKARCIPEPRTQYATLLIYDASSSVDSLTSFNVDDALVKQLSCFQACAMGEEPTVEQLKQKLDHIYEDLETNVTRIFQRRDMHLIYDLAYHSVLTFPFQGRPIKGWVEVLVLGDSGQGKSEAIKHLQQHYGLGDKLDSKNATLAGLLGGATETAKRWFISWGTVTLNDRRLVVLEEVKGMSTDIISKMTDARSSGFVELSKIVKARTTCRCRLIWISNPRSQRQLSTYNYGVEAVKELLGSLEDVRRFDAAIVVASGEVATTIVNQKSADVKHVDHEYTSDLCCDLVLWAWSRSPEQVIITPEATEEILQAANRMGNTYSSAIPLVEASDQRLKIARLATALAARVYSTDDGERLIVHKAHVQVIEETLTRIYATKAFGYHEYSMLIKGEGTLDDEHTVIKAFADLPHPLDTVRSILEANMIVATDIQDFGAVDYDTAKSFIGHLVRKRALKRYKSAYVKTPAFIGLLKRLRDKPGELVLKEAPAYMKAASEV